PAATQCALAVTSVGPGGVKTSFANYGKWITFAAPGEGIYSTFPVSGYAWWSGTSMAVPFVTGQAALLASVDPTLNPRQIAQLIGGTAVSLDTANPAYVGQLGAGQPDMEASLSALLSGNIPASARGLMSGSCVTAP
ncbi:MAG TPA: S8 family serine peptidase, partial [Anaerolineales bacterium]|nr:S8 family serine peptidase [Anaerolineales bacterium]